MNESAGNFEDNDQDGESAPRKERLRIRRRVRGRRLDKYLRARFPRMSRTMLQRLIKEGDVTVNGLPTKASYEPASGDIVEMLVPPPPPTDVIPEDIPLDILYEDDHIIAINKQVGIICHPAGPWQSGTIANAVAFHAATLSHGDDPYRPGIVHRLDKNTSGVMLIAKNDEAHWRLSLQFERRTTQKTYFAICEGMLSRDQDIIDQPLGAHPMIKDRYMNPGQLPRAMLFKEAITRYEAKERFKGFTVVHLSPKTGRTHQLRVHMSAIGHPLMGDTYYGGHLFSEKDIAGERLEEPEEPLIGIQALHAMAIEFVHPIHEKPMRIEAPIPENLCRIVDLLRTHRSY
ncbi:MAG: RluA family pseudouridine synthase [Phycisphaerae bacterium]|nr:RluA family pseudouridine synthase [Phycisphaerae bacterium]